MHNERTGGAVMVLGGRPTILGGMAVITAVRSITSLQSPMMQSLATGGCSLQGNPSAYSLNDI